MGNGSCCTNIANACVNNELCSDINYPNSDIHSFTYISNNESKINQKNRNTLPNETNANTNIFFQKNIYANTCSNAKLTKSPEQKPLCTSVKQIYPPLNTTLYNSETILHNTPSYYGKKPQNQNIEKFLEPYTFKDQIDYEVTNKIKNNNKDNNKDNNNDNNKDNNQNNSFQNNNIQNNKNKLDDIYLKFSQFGEPNNDNDFSPDGWKEFYPKDDYFFNWNKGNVIPNQLLIKNADSEKVSEIEIYSGETNNYNQKHGFGTLTNYRYIQKGNWRNDNFTGWGRESRRNGVTLEGKFIDGYVNGKGILKNNSGNIYKGDFINNIREGKGILKTPKFTYEGDFKNNVLNGTGKIKFTPEEHFYEGQFKNNNIDGKGIFKWKNGDEYDGFMKNGKMDGYGTYRYADGDYYEGYYLNGVKEGKGKFVSYTEKEIYEGEFKNGKPHGKGVLLKNGENKNVEFYEGKLIKVEN